MRAPMVGRDAETAAIRSAYERMLAARRAVVLVCGEAGIGKSRLLSAVLPTLADDPLVLSGDCLELGSEGAPYVPFVAILRDLVRRIGRDRVTALLPSDGTALGDLLPTLGPAPARYGRTRLLEEMLALITEVARERPVVMVVEDLHWADASSRELFAYLARNLSGAVLLIGSLRTGELAIGHPNRQLLAELGRHGEVTRIDVGPLAHSDVVELLTAVDGVPPDPVRSARIHRRSGGNPLFVEALSPTGVGPGDDLRALLLDRITRLPDAAREVLAMLAVAGTGLTDELLAEAGQVDLDQLQPAVTDLVGRDLVVVVRDGYQIRHDLIREAVYASVLPAQRRRFHARYADALAARGSGTVTDTVAMAEHWTAAGALDRALPAAWRAAELTARQNAFDEQLHLLDLILTHWSEVADPVEVVGADRVTVLEHAAEAALAAGKSASGINHSTSALSGLDPAAHPHRVARLLGLRGQLRNRVDGTGLDDLERAVALVPPGAADALRGWLLAALGFVCVGTYRLDDSRRYAEEALAIATRLADDGLRARALLVTAALDGAAGEIEPARCSFAAARRLADDDHTFLTSFQWEADLLETTGHYEQAASLAHEGRLAAERMGLARSRGSMLAVAQAVPLLLLGRWDEAVQVVDDTLQQEPPPLYGAFLRLVAADIARRRGRTEQFEVLLRGLTEFAQRAQGAAEAIAGIVVQRVAWALDSGELDLADRIVREHLHAAWPARETMRLAVLGARVQRARRAAAPRNRPLAAECTSRLTELSRLGDTVPVANAELRAYRLTLRALTVAASLSTWDEATAAWRDLGDPYETATALTDAAATALGSNNRPGAVSRLRQARALATDLGAGPLLARIDDLAGRGRLAEAATTLAHNDFGLTRRELDVLRVVARGRSNAQIAEELFISTNTVATHVARILGKLDATTRTEAVGRARETGLLDA